MPQFQVSSMRAGTFNQTDKLALEPQYIKTKTGVNLRTAVFKKQEPKQNKNVCVLLQGRSEFIEKYREVISELCARGFTVATFDWRGQGGSQRALTNPMHQHVENFAEYDEDFDAFMEQIVEPLRSAPPLVLAHSMGGHLSFRAIQRHPSSFSGVITTAPMIDVYGRSRAKLFIPVLNKLGFSKAPFFVGKRSDPLNVSFEQNVLTSDRKRFNRMISEIKKHPELRIGAPTWGWLKAASDSINKINSKGFADSISNPVLIFGAGKDRVCVTKAAKDFALRLPQGSYLEIPQAEHEILMEKDAIREEFWQGFDDFLKTL